VEERLMPVDAPDGGYTKAITGLCGLRKDVSKHAGT
jgi:hypothetical protein